MLTADVGAVGKPTEEIRHTRSYTAYNLSSASQSRTNDRRSAPLRRNRSDGRGAGTARQLDFGAELDDIFGRGALRDLQQLEDFMLMEAIQQSMLESQRQQGQQGQQGQQLQQQQPPRQEAAPAPAAAAPDTIDAGTSEPASQASHEEERPEAGEQELLAAALMLSMGGGTETGDAVSTPVESEHQAQETKGSADEATVQSPLKAGDDATDPPCHIATPDSQECDALAEAKAAAVHWLEPDFDEAAT
jgi:hypothetical protein